MARHWKGKRSLGKRGEPRYRRPRQALMQSPMCGGFVESPYPAPPPRPSRDERLDPRDAYFVTVCGFTFEFWSVEQIVAALRFYREKVHPSSRMPIWGEHDVTQRWFERVPQYLQANGKRA